MTEVTVSPERFTMFMSFETANPPKDRWEEGWSEAWSAGNVNEYLTAIGATMMTEAEVAAMRQCYEASPRSYHGPEHGAFVGQPYLPPSLIGRLGNMDADEAKSVSALAGLLHDTAYKNVDMLPHDRNSAWPQDVWDKIGDFAWYTTPEENGSQFFVSSLTERGKQDPMIQIVAQVFGYNIDTNSGLEHNKGGNEFDSALYAAKLLEAKGVSRDHILSIVTMIAATVPFRAATMADEYPYPDGYMGALAHRIKNIPMDDGMERSWANVDDVMLLSVYLANRDVSPFLMSKNFAALVNGGRMVKKEEVPELRQGVVDMQQLARAARLFRSAPALYGMLSSQGFVLPEKVPHFYVLRKDIDSSALEPAGDVALLDAYPAIDVYEAAVANVKENTRLASLFFQSHEAGILVARSLAALVEDDQNAEVPGFVQSSLWTLRLSEPWLDWLRSSDPSAFAVYEAMVLGKGQMDIDSATTEKSPIGGTLLAFMGSERMAGLSEYIQGVYNRNTQDVDPFGEPSTALDFLKVVADRMGSVDQLQPIIEQLAQLADANGKSERAHRLRSAVARLRP